MTPDPRKCEACKEWGTIVATIPQTDDVITLRQCPKCKAVWQE